VELRDRIAALEKENKRLKAENLAIEDEKNETIRIVTQ
jgi:uncharacterized small protein (DUF1192 family)